MSTSQPYFSIIIPTYNRAQTITNTLNSVYKQSFKDYEILIIDNNSTDNIEEILRIDIDQNKVKFFKNDSNYERSYSRNRGLELATGQFALLLDSDDLLYPYCLEDAYQYSVQNPKHLLFHNLYEFVDEDNQTSKGTDLYDPNNTFKSIARGNFLACNGVFMAKEVYKKHRFDLKAVGSEDWDFWLRVIADTKHLGRIDKVNSAIFIHSGRSMANLDLDKVVATKTYILNKLKNDKELASFYKPYMNFMVASAYLFMASSANTCKKFSKSFRFLAIALNHQLKVGLSRRFFVILANGFLGILKLK
ncbi:MAG: glycosyltransferase [bacterium]|nr:glycosyltransferase [bacterium]